MKLIKFMDFFQFPQTFPNRFQLFYRKISYFKLIQITAKFIQTEQLKC